jgi:membrane fusion protein, multidrug efflux system
MSEHAPVRPLADAQAPVGQVRVESRADPASRVQAPPPDVKPTGEARRRSIRVRVIAGALALAFVALGWWLYARRYEDTDDAQIDGNISAVSPRVAGTVVAVHVVDNQEVKAGDLLVELDATDLRVALAQAKANVAQAEAQVSAENPNVPITQTSNAAAMRNADAEVESARTDLDAAEAELEQAKANDRLARVDLARAEQLIQGGSIARAEYDQRGAAADVTRAAVVAARRRAAGKQAKLDAALARQREVRQNAPRQLGTREAALQARRAYLELAQAQLEEAKLNLGYARIVAPADGIIGRKSVNVGDRVQPGQQLMALTQTGDLWVTANFRETQLQHMRAGQHARVSVDGLSRDFEGEVESFAGATGSRYSLLPPENATGNYVKVVQRIPVRIRLDHGQPDLKRLRPGMSVEPKVWIR